MTDKKFNVGDRVFDDVYLEFGVVCKTHRKEMCINFNGAHRGYLKDGYYLSHDKRPRLHKSNSEQELQLVLDEIMRKYKESR